MNYQNRVVLFLDILGFKNILDKTLDKEEQDDTKRINQLHETLSLMYNEVSWKKSSKETSRVVTQFSDTIVVSFLENDKAEVITFFDDVLSLLTQLVSRGILCRGAVSYGKLIHSDKIIFGPALVDAYLTESKAAMYPRVILDRTLVETIREAKEPYFRKLFSAVAGVPPKETRRGRCFPPPTTQPKDYLTNLVNTCFHKPGSNTGRTKIKFLRSTISQH